MLDVASNASTVSEVCTYEWQDGLFDVVWSETDPNLLVAASGDGIIHIWDISAPQVCNLQVMLCTKTQDSWIIFLSAIE